MKIVKDLKIQTVVILANRAKEELFLPSMFSQYWLNENGIIDAKNIKPNSLFSPEIAQVLSDRLNLVVVPDQIQVSSSDTTYFEEIVTKKCTTIINNIEKIGFKGIGINFSWFIKDESMSLTELSQALFSKCENPISQKFKENDAMFGAYFSKNISEDVRLKLEIKPVILNDSITGKTEDWIQCAFNYHSDINGEDKKRNIISILENYQKWNETTIDIMNTFK